MTAIMKRELSAYFTSAVGYVFIGVFYLFAALFFYFTALANNLASLTYVYSNMFTIVLFLIPVLTMRLLSEDRKQKTDQALFTAPVSLTAVALGKYFAAVIVFVISISITLLFTLIMAVFTTPDFAVLFANWLGMLLLGAALISIGMFLSSLTENQVIAAVAGFAVGLFILLLDVIVQAVNVSFIKSILNAISFNAHYDNFTVGVIDIADVVFFLSIITAFVFLTIRVFEKRRWS